MNHNKINKSLAEYCKKNNKITLVWLLLGSMHLFLLALNLELKNDCLLTFIKGFKCKKS